MNSKLKTLTLNHVYIAVALVLLALRPLLTAIPPHDFWWHLATGRAIIQQGTIPSVDSFSYTRAGEPFYNQGWLAQLLMYGLHQLGGVELLLIVQALVIVLAYGLLLRLCILRSGRLRLSVALLLLTTLPLSFDNWTIRPQSYAFPLFAAFLTILTEYRLGLKNRLWLLPPLLALWANLHGSFVLGLALIGITWVGMALSRVRRERTVDGRPQTVDNSLKTDERVQERGVQSHLLPSVFRPPSSVTTPQLAPLFTTGLLATLAALMNPRGPALFGYVRDLLGTSAVTSLVTEWTPPTIRDTGGAIFFLFLFVLVALLAYARGRPALTDMLLLGVFTWLALGATRSIVWFGFVATPLLVSQAATLLAPARPAAPGAPRLNAALLGLLGLLLLIGLPWVKPLLLPPPSGALLSEDTPVAAVVALKQLPERPKRLFHAMSYGSYLIWAAPEQPVFIDPRIELYPYRQWVDYINLGQANNLAELLARYQFDGLLLHQKEQAALIAAIRAEGGWKLEYEDERTVLFVRSP